MQTIPKFSTACRTSLLDFTGQAGTGGGLFKVCALESARINFVSIAECAKFAISLGINAGEREPPRFSRVWEALVTEMRMHRHKFQRRLAPRASERHEHRATNKLEALEARLLFMSSAATTRRGPITGQ